MEKFLLALEEGVFSHPASDWEEYQKRLGRWAELTHLIETIQGKLQEDDK
jgi:hypothetical protein